MSHLYYVKSKSGQKVLFQPNWAQKILLEGLWYSNVILKARQLGVTTFFCLLYLDDTLFSRNRNTVVIAHTLKDAQEIFGDKIQFAWDNLPQWLKDAYVVNSETKNELSFALRGYESEPSKIRVTTSARSGTVQNLHVSELGPMGKLYPEKAKEVKTGSLNTVQSGQLISIESTAAGREGLFYEIASKAHDLQKLGRKLSPMDFKFFFFPWWKHPDYVLSNPVPITTEMREYFERLEVEIGQRLTDQQMFWYVKKRETQGEEMFREYPSTPEEAFHASIEGAYYASQMSKVFSDQRVRPVPYNPLLPVETWWDLGMDDYTVIILVQYLAQEIRVFDVIYGQGEGLAYYASELSKRGYRYSRHVLPHDVAVRELGTGISRLESLGKLGVRPVTIAQDPNGHLIPVDDGIEAVRNMLGRCYFDESRCAKLVSDLQAYRKKWSEPLGQFLSSPLHDEHSHGADAFRTGATMLPRYSPSGIEREIRRTGAVVPDNDKELSTI